VPKDLDDQGRHGTKDGGTDFNASESRFDAIEIVAVVTTSTG
jgi:hypothetical protein